MKKIFIILLAISLPLFILLKSIELNTFDKEFYLETFVENRVLETTEKDLEELGNVTEDIFNYLKGEVDETIMEPYFSEREILHMVDVRYLFKCGFIIKNISLLFLIISAFMLLLGKNYKSLGKSILFGSLIWIGSIFVLLLLSLSDFNKYFTYFHKIFFNNDLWILNPKTDLLIQMLPQNFFVTIFIKIALLFLLVLAILVIIGFILMRKGRDYDRRIIKF